MPRQYAGGDSQSNQRWLWLALSVGAVAAVCACQDYPFETRFPSRVQATQIDEVITTIRPTDILFVVDNSGSMVEETRELTDNMRRFVELLGESNTDFQVGIVTPDVECNIPERNCAAGVSSEACCNRFAEEPKCRDRDLDADGVIDASNCDGGRLRANPETGRRVFTPPPPGEVDAWVDEIVGVLTPIESQGSAYEASFEAARRAVLCGAGHPDCPDPAIADLNAGFIRTEADLVLIFLSDEDDCSFVDTTAYEQLNQPSSAIEQGNKLCSPRECYAFYGRVANAPNDEIPGWQQLFKCSGAERQVYPPEPVRVDTFLDAYASAKGGDIRRVRAAAVASSVTSEAAPLGYRAAACDFTAGVPNAECGCWSIYGDNTGFDPAEFYCALTGLLGQNNTGDGCAAMPGQRYFDLLETLASRRRAAGVAADTLADTICRAQYTQTLRDIVFNVIISSCFDMGAVPETAADIRLRRNNERVPQVAPGSNEDGWSWRPGSSQICLEGDLRKEIGDAYEIFVVGSDNAGASAAEGG
mgnify:CR=1 FL=1